MPHRSFRLSIFVATLLMVTGACGMADRKSTSGHRASPENRAPAPGELDRLKRALLPFPAAQSEDAWRYGPLAGPYRQLTDRIADGKAWGSEPCAKKTLLPWRILRLGEQARSSPAALAMWTDEARDLTVTETVIKLTTETSRLLVMTPAPEECRSYDILLEGEKNRATLAIDELSRRDIGSKRIQLWEYRAGKTTQSALQLTIRRGEYVILLGLSPNGRSEPADYQDLIEQAEDHATTALRQGERSRT